MLYNQQGWQQGGHRSGPATSTAPKKKKRHWSGFKGGPNPKTLNQTQ